MLNHLTHQPESGSSPPSRQPRCRSRPAWQGVRNGVCTVALHKNKRPSACVPVRSRTDACAFPKAQLISTSSRHLTSCPIFHHHLRPPPDSFPCSSSPSPVSFQPALFLFPSPPCLSSTGPEESKRDRQMLSDAGMAAANVLVRSVGALPARAVETAFRNR